MVRKKLYLDGVINQQTFHVWGLHPVGFRWARHIFSAEIHAMSMRLHPLLAVVASSHGLVQNLVHLSSPELFEYPLVNQHSY